MVSESKPRRGAPPHHFVDDEWLALRTEAVLEPERPIIDPHHHLWDRPHSRYLLPEILADLHTGHMVRGTVFVECSSMYRADGDPAFACVGEAEFVNGVAAMSASGIYGPVRVAAGIVGRADLTRGDAAGGVLDALVAHAPDRFRGIRHMAAWDPSPEVSTLLKPPPKGLLADSSFRAGFAHLAPRGLTFDAWVYHPQLPELVELVDLFPNTTVVVNHLGGKAGTGPYARNPDDVFRVWRVSVEELARRPNVVIKLGGIGMRLAGFDFMDRDLPPSSEQLAAAFRPAVDVCLSAFGADRAMFESNFPVDKACCSYRVLWNTFKRLAAGCSEHEKASLFAGTAARVYSLGTELCAPP